MNKDSEDSKCDCCGSYLNSRGECEDELKSRELQRQRNLEIKEDTEPKIQDFKKEFADSFAIFLESIRAQREKPCHICGKKPETGCCKDLDGITRHDFFDGP